MAIGELKMVKVTRMGVLMPLIHRPILVIFTTKALTLILLLASKHPPIGP
jgi:hypothetical protein